MPASLNLVGDNKCMVRVIRGSVSDSIGASGELLIHEEVDGDIGNRATISVCQRIVLGDALLNNIMPFYSYNSTTDKTDVGFMCTNNPDHAGAVHLNYTIIV